MLRIHLGCLSASTFDPSVPSRFYSTWALGRRTRARVRPSAPYLGRAQVTQVLAARVRKPEALGPAQVTQVLAARARSTWARPSDPSAPR